MLPQQSRSLDTKAVRGALIYGFWVIGHHTSEADLVKVRHVELDGAGLAWSEASYRSEGPADNVVRFFVPDNFICGDKFDRGRRHRCRLEADRADWGRSGVLWIYSRAG